MTTIIVQEDCGNAPKKVLLRDLNVAFARGESDFILDHLTDTVIWDYVGGKRVEGKDAVKVALQEAKNDPKSEMTLLNIITHGSIGSANGTMVLENGRHVAFCHVYAFSSAAKTAKIKAITSYLIEM